MMSFKNYILFFLSFSLSTWCQTEVFKHIDTYLSIGVDRPAGNLSKIMDPSPSFGWILFTPYYKSVTAVVEMRYSQYSAHANSLPIRSLHHVKSGIGLEYSFPHFFIPAVGFGVGHYFVRTKGNPVGTDYLLDSNESEFGAYPSFRWCWSGLGNFRLLLSTELDIIFSDPNYSFIPNISLGFGWSWK